MTTPQPAPHSVRPNTPETTGASTLERNLAAIRLRQPQLADLLARTSPRADFQLVRVGGGECSGTIGAEGRALASLRRPRDEAARWAAGVEVTGAGTFVIPGFGVGAHVEALRARLGPHGVLIAFEPDLGLLRAVLEHVDCAGWLSTVIIAHDPLDTAGLASALKGLEPLVALGVALLEHPPSAARVGAQWGQFGSSVAQLVRATRTNIATSLVHSETTLRNLLMNIDAYALGPGIDDLAGAAAGRAAVVVSAGPSLARNIDLLARPGVRDRVVIIAVQTVLKTLLARGIRPHYVTALDHHEISRRFYEGLRREDVAGVELIAEAKVNAAVTQAFPGVVRFPADERLDKVLGPELVRPRGSVEAGATVAHLAYLFARHLGCDPVILVGQDLGFTLGQYYAAGAAIHEVWSSELGPFRTLETLEWERIARSKGLLTRATDQRGRAAYTDEQMNAYLVQFERHFAEDGARGRRVIDATEGGVLKRHTQVMTLAEALEASAGAPVLDLPRAEGAPRAGGGDEGRLRTLRRRVETLEVQASRVRELCAATLEGLECVQRGESLTKHHRAIEAARAEVFTLEPAFGLVQFLSQNAALNRYRADRTIALTPGRDEAETQALRLERDLANLRWLGEAAERLVSLLGAASRAIRGGARLTRDVEETEAPETGLSIGRERQAAAIVWADPERGALGDARSLDAPVGAERNVLRFTLERLAQARTVGRVIVLCDDPERVRAIAGAAPAGLTLDIVQRENPGTPMPSPRVASARRWGSASWRGGPGGLLAHDEVFDAREAAAIMRLFNLPGAIILGADWCLIDPALADEIVRRHWSAPAQHRLVFCQAPPGLAPIYIDAGLTHELAQAGPLASLGMLLGYQPAAPRPDPIAKGACVTINASVRDLGVRCIAGDAASLGAMQQALRVLGDRALEAGTDELAPLWADRLEALHERGPAHIELELCTGRLTSGLLGAWRRGPYEAPERRPAPIEGVRAALTEAAGARPGVLLTLAGAGDPLRHPQWRECVQAAHEAGIAGVHLRTDLLCDEATCQALLAAPLDAISIDLGAHRPETYARLRGINGLDAARAGALRLAQAARAGAGGPWIVPRLVKCDDVIGEFEDFYDFWLSRTGACVLDALPRAVDGLDVRPLPLPARARARLEGAGLIVLSDGSAVLGTGRLAGNVFSEGLTPAWKRIRRERAARERASRAGETQAA